MESLVLKDAGLHFGRNATFATNILAQNANVTLDSDELYIDLEDGNGVETRPVLGRSKALVQADQSRFKGRVQLTDQSTLTINEPFIGGIDSATRVASTQAELTQPSEFTRSSLALADNARLTSRADLHSDGDVLVGPGAVLSIRAAPQDVSMRTTYSATSWRLQGAMAALDADAGTRLLGDILADGDASISLGGGDVVAPGLNATTVYTGAVTANQAAMQIHDNGHWLITGDSALNRLQASSALLSFGDKPRTESVFLAQPNSGNALTMRQIETTSTNPSYALTVDTLAASDSVFVFRAAPYSGAHDQMTVTTLLNGSGNRLRAAYSGDEQAGEPVQARETLLLSAPAATPADLFTPETYFVRSDASDTPAQSDPWRSGLAVNHDANQRQWWLISMSDEAPWRLTENRGFDLLHLPSAERVALSQPGPAWTPHELRVDTMIASGVHFAMTARPQSHESDSIRISSLAQGDDNRLDLTPLVHDPVPANDSGALLLATAPVAALDSYFQPGSVTQGLTLYVPNLEIVSTGTEKKWQLAYRAAETVVTPDQTPIPDDAPNAALPDSAGPTDEPADKPDAPAETSRPDTGGLSLFTPYSLKLPELDTLRSRGEIISRLRQTGIIANDDIVNQINALRQQINRTAALASLPKVAFVLETNQLNKRLGDVRQLHEEAGLWIKTSHGRADYQQVHLKHNTLQLGLDRKNGMHLYGVMGSYTQGSGQGDAGLSEKHTTGGIGVYYALINEDGPFIDIIAKYLRTNHTYQMPANLRIEDHGAQSTSLLASMRAGWRQNLFNDRAFIEPSVEVVTSYTSAYTLHGNESSVDVRVNASTPIHAKIGVAAGLNFQSDEQRGLTLSAGLFRLQNLRRGGSIDALNNSVQGDMLSTPMVDDSRYLVNVSLNARLSPNWRLYNQVKSSFAGKLEHDYSGQIGVRHQF